MDIIVSNNIFSILLDIYAYNVFLTCTDESLEIVLLIG